MKQIEQIEILHGNYYLAYLNDVIKYKLILCHSPSNGGYQHTTLLGVDTDEEREYNFGSAWELFELTEDEWNRQIIMEEI